MKNDISIPKSFARIIGEEFILYWDFLEDNSVNLMFESKRS
jgi:hypothetical protein